MFRERFGIENKVFFEMADNKDYDIKKISAVGPGNQMTDNKSTVFINNYQLFFKDLYQRKPVYWLISPSTRVTFRTLRYQPINLILDHI